MASIGSVPALATETLRPHTYAFDQPALVSAQRVFGVGHATVMLGEACSAFPEAAVGYQIWLEKNAVTLQGLTETLAAHYRIDPNAPNLRTQVAAAMHLKTTLNLSESQLEEACPTLPQALSSAHYDLEQRYRETLKEVRQPDYLNPKRKATTSPQPDLVPEENPHHE